jgi:uncharacterized NAD(P)/FAD-binding protein YdhS
MVAAHLLKESRGQRLRVVLLDRARIARGTAYAEREFPYPLNVPAARMSAESAAPLEFLEFARRRVRLAAPEDFLPRALYGEYLEWKLSCAEHSGSPHIRLERMVGEVCAVARDQARSGFQLQLAHGRRLKANQVVLASGAPAPHDLPELSRLRGSPAYVENPWRAPLSVGPTESVLLVGSGPTMADITLALSGSAGNRLQIHALSRHGWLPAAQKPAPMREYGVDSGALLAAAAVSMRQLYRAVRDEIEHLQARGGDWRDAINGVRQSAPLIWQRLAIGERRRFLRHVRTLWDIHRHRLPPASAAALEQLRLSGRLQVHAGRLISVMPCGDRITVRWRARGSTEASLLSVDRIINCSGTSHDPRRTSEPLWRSLLSQRLASADPLGLGVRTGRHGSVLNDAGAPVDDLYYIGPMLQATHWECTAVPELRGRAEDLARHLLVHDHERSRVGLASHSRLLPLGREGTAALTP